MPEPPPAPSDADELAASAHDAHAPPAATAAPASKPAAAAQRPFHLVSLSGPPPYLFNAFGPKYFAPVGFVSEIEFPSILHRGRNSWYRNEVLGLAKYRVTHAPEGREFTGRVFEALSPHEAWKEISGLTGADLDETGAKKFVDGVLMFGLRRKSVKLSVDELRASQEGGAPAAAKQSVADRPAVLCARAGLPEAVAAPPPSTPPSAPTLNLPPVNPRLAAFPPAVAISSSPPAATTATPAAAANPALAPSPTQSTVVRYEGLVKDAPEGVLQTALVETLRVLTRSNVPDPMQLIGLWEMSWVASKLWLKPPCAEVQCRSAMQVAEYLGLLGFDDALWRSSEEKFKQGSLPDWCLPKHLEVLFADEPCPAPWPPLRCMYIPGLVGTLRLPAGPAAPKLELTCRVANDLANIVCTVEVARGPSLRCIPLSSASTPGEALREALGSHALKTRLFGQGWFVRPAGARPAGAAAEAEEETVRFEAVVAPGEVALVPGRSLLEWVAPQRKGLDLVAGDVVEAARASELGEWVSDVSAMQELVRELNAAPPLPLVPEYAWEPREDLAPLPPRLVWLRIARVVAPLLGEGASPYEWVLSASQDALAALELFGLGLPARCRVEALLGRALREQAGYELTFAMPHERRSLLYQARDRARDAITRVVRRYSRRAQPQRALIADARLGMAHHDAAPELGHGAQGWKTSARRILVGGWESPPTQEPGASAVWRSAALAYGPECARVEDELPRVADCLVADVELSLSSAQGLFARRRAVLIAGAMGLQGTAAIRECVRLHDEMELRGKAAAAAAASAATPGRFAAMVLDAGGGAAMQKRAAAASAAGSDLGAASGKRQRLDMATAAGEAAGERSKRRSRNEMRSDLALPHPLALVNKLAAYCVPEAWRGNPQPIRKEVGPLSALAHAVSASLGPTPQTVEQEIRETAEAMVSAVMENRVWQWTSEERAALERAVMQHDSLVGLVRYMQTEAVPSLAKYSVTGIVNRLYQRYAYLFREVHVARRAALGALQALGCSQLARLAERAHAKGKREEEQVELQGALAHKTPQQLAETWKYAVASAVKLGGLPYHELVCGYYVRLVGAPDWTFVGGLRALDPAFAGTWRLMREGAGGWALGRQIASGLGAADWELAAMTDGSGVWWFVAPSLSSSDATTAPSLDGGLAAGSAAGGGPMFELGSTTEVVLEEFEM